jgi:hypothetical protein
MIVKKTPDGRFVDAATGVDLSELIKAYRTVQARIAAGSARTPAKRRAAQENGRLGGRPKGSKNKSKKIAQR